MRLRYTPLFITAVGIIIFGLYYICYHSDTEVGPIAGILVILLGMLCIGFYFIARILFHAHSWLNLLAEVLIICAVMFFGFKLTRKVQLFLPTNYKGCLLLVYGVDKAPRYKVDEFYHRNIHIMVPSSGIVLMGNKFADKYMNNLLVLDGTHSQALEPGRYVNYEMDTLKCGSKRYIVEALTYQYPLTAKRDTAAIRLKKQEALKLLCN